MTSVEIAVQAKPDEWVVLGTLSDGKMNGSLSSYEPGGTQVYQLGRGQVQIGVCPVGDLVHD